MNFAKLVNLAMDCEFGNVVAKLASGLRIWQSGLRIWQWVCELGNGLRIWQCGLRNWQCGLRNWQCGLRNWQCQISLRFCSFCVRQMNSACGLRISQCELRLRTWLPTHCEIRNGCELFANTLRNSQWLRTVCEQFAKILFCCFFHVSHPVFNCISFLPLFLCFSIDFWACCWLRLNFQPCDRSFVLRLKSISA